RRTPPRGARRGPGGGRVPGLVNRSTPPLRPLDGLCWRSVARPSKVGATRPPRPPGPPSPRGAGAIEPAGPMRLESPMSPPRLLALPLGIAFLAIAPGASAGIKLKAIEFPAAATGTKGPETPPGAAPLSQRVVFVFNKKPKLGPAVADGL